MKKGTIDPTALDARMLEDERLRVLTVERLVLETICFKFEVDTAVSIVVKIAKALERESPVHRSLEARAKLINSREEHVPAVVARSGRFVSWIR